MSEKKEKTNSKSGSSAIITVILLSAVGIIFVIWLVSMLIKSDKKEIKKKADISAVEISSSEDELPLATEEIDLEKIRQNYGYISISSEQVDSGLLAITENNPQKLVPVYNSLFTTEGLQIASEKSSKFKCSSEMSAPLNEMLNAFYSETGLRTIIINDAYSAEKAQDEEDSEGEYYSEDDYYSDGYYDEYGNYIEYDIYDSTEDEAAEPEACSEHFNGCSIDLGVYIKKSGKFDELSSDEKYSWFESNSWKYGFILRYPAEKTVNTGFDYCPYHFRYVGKSASYVMHHQNLTLEEFMMYIKDYSYDSPLNVSVEGHSELIYYIGDSGLDTTSAQVPQNSDGSLCDYSISGNSIDGYIITVLPTAEFSAVTEAGGEITESDADTSDTSAEQ